MYLLESLGICCDCGIYRYIVLFGVICILVCVNYKVRMSEVYVGGKRRKCVVYERNLCSL